MDTDRLIDEMRRTGRIPHFVGGSGRRHSMACGDGARCEEAAVRMILERLGEVPQGVNVAAPVRHEFLEGVSHPATCQGCGEDVEPGGARWNGEFWEHKSSRGHAQAGHHPMEAPAEGDS